MERVSYEDIDREMGVFGDPDYCVDRVRALHREYGMDEFICYFNQGGMMEPANGQGDDARVRPGWSCRIAASREKSCNMIKFSLHAGRAAAKIFFYVTLIAETAGRQARDLAVAETEERHAARLERRRARQRRGWTDRRGWCSLRLTRGLGGGRR